MVASEVLQSAVNSASKEWENITDAVLGSPSTHLTNRITSTEPELLDRQSEELDMPNVLCTGRCGSSSPLSEGSVLDNDFPFFSGNHKSQPRAASPSLQALAPSAQHSENNAAYFLWPPAYRLLGTAEERATYFNGLQKRLHSERSEWAPTGQQATTLLDLMTIRASHSLRLRQVSLATAVGFRTKEGVLTNIPAIIVFVARKVNEAWLHESQRLPAHLEGPGGVWCDVDVVEFSYYGAQAVTPKEQVYTELVEQLRGSDSCIGPGSQVASQETCGTLGAIVRSRTGARRVGFLTNRHVAVDLDYPNQKMFHPLPPKVGPGVYLGAVERATSFITDDWWYSIFASTNPETFVRADGAFIPFGDSFDLRKVTPTVKGIGDMGDVMGIDLQAPISSVVGRQVVKVGRSSGLTKGSIMAYALEYNDEKGICFFTDFLIVGENKQGFDLEGDSGSLILITEESGKKPRPVGIIWGGTANRGRLKLWNGHGPESWTSGVDLGRLLELLRLDLITSRAALEDAIEEQRWEKFSPRPLCTSHPGEGNDSLLKFGITDQTHQLGQREELGRAGINPDLAFMGTSGLDGSPIGFLKEIDFGIRHIERNTEYQQHQGLSALKKISTEDLSVGLHPYARDAKRKRE